MDSTVMPRSTEANDALAARADERLAHAYEQIARADEQLARLTEQLTKMEQEDAHHPSAIPLRRPSRGRPALRGLVGLLAAACIVGAAFVSQSSYGEAARPAIARLAAPYISSVSWLVLATPELPAQPAPSGVQVATAEAASPQTTPSVRTGLQDIGSPTAALGSPELAQLLQTMARDLTTVQQGIEELKASQERMASDNAKAVEQVKASQEQMTRLVAKVSEQDQRARTPAPPPQPIANPTRKPAPAQASSQARAQPLQLQPATR
jgi:predicted FMN-binding regulatory protein PaiB